MENTPVTSPNKKKEIGLAAALIPVIALIIVLYYNVRVFGDNALGGSNQFVLLIGGAIAAIVGFAHKIPYSKGGSSKDSKNIQLLCQTCNLKKSNKLEY